MTAALSAFSYLLVVGAGVSVALQQVLNANLRAELGSPWWAGFVSYCVGMGIVKLSGESRELGELDGAPGWCGLCGLLDATDVVPRLEGAGPIGAVVGGGHAVAGQEEKVVDLVVGGEEALGMPGRLEPLHLPFSSSRRLV